MKATPVVCPHGKVTSWEFTDARPNVPLPAIEHCPDCDPDAVEVPSFVIRAVPPEGSLSSQPVGEGGGGDRPD